MASDRHRPPGVGPGALWRILLRPFALHKVYPMQFLICREVRKQVYTFRCLFFLGFFCFLFYSLVRLFSWFSLRGRADGFFIYISPIYKHTTCLKVLIWFLGPGLRGPSFLSDCRTHKSLWGFWCFFPVPRRPERNIVIRLGAEDLPLCPCYGLVGLCMLPPAEHMLTLGVLVPTQEGVLGSTGNA